MGLSMMSALMIQGNGDNVKCEAGGPHKETGKWAGWINLYKHGDFHTAIVSTQGIYDSKEEALKAMEALVEEVREMDLLVPKKEEP